MDKETIEILKNPHDNAALLTKDFLKGCGFKNVGDTHSHEIEIYRDKEKTIYINLYCRYISNYGFFDLWVRDPDNFINFLENCFEFPLLPTKEERELFYIEHGFEYPIPSYEGEL